MEQKNLHRKIRLLFSLLLLSVFGVSQTPVPFSSLPIQSTCDTVHDKIVYLHWNGSTYSNGIIAPSKILKTIPYASSHTNGLLDSTHFKAFSGNQNNTPLYFAKAATTSPLSTTYSSGTLTATANGRLSTQDGTTIGLGDILLVKNNSAQLQNGLYVVYDTGNLSNTYKMYRDSSYNESSEIYPSQINVLQGTVNGGAYFIQTTVTPTVGVSPIVYISTPAPTSVASSVAFVDVVIETPLPNSPVYTSGTNTVTPGLNAKYTSGTNVAFPTINGVAPFPNMKILVIGQADQTKNGDYTLILGGSSACPFCWPWVLQRVSYTASSFYPRLWEVLGGTKKGAIYQQNNKSLTDANIGISGNITFTKISPPSTTFIGVGSTTVTTTGTAPTQTITINSAGGTSGWSLTGNSGTTPGTDFIGTTDNKSLIVKTNNLPRVKFDSTGHTGIGTQYPRATLQIGDSLVKGKLRYIDTTYGQGKFLMTDSNGYVSCQPWGGYKKYTAIMTQSGTLAPVPTILENTLGFTPVWSRNAAGNFSLTQTGGFPANKTFITQLVSYDAVRNVSVTPSVYLPHLPDKVTSLMLQTNNFLAVDGQNWWIEIRVYP